MFLFERLFGITVYSICVFVCLNLISKAKNLKQVKHYLILFVISLGIMGYFYHPYYTADLYSIRTMILDNYQYKSFEEIIANVAYHRWLLYPLYYWIFGKIGNLNLLPAVTAVFFYTNSFTIIYKSAKKFNYSPKTIAKMVLFLMAGGQFIEVISGIKSLFAFSIVALCCYLEFVENKSLLKHTPLYIFAALMHDAAAVLVLFRIVFLLFQKEEKSIYKVRNVIALLLAGAFVLKMGGQTLNGALEKGETYVNGNVYSNIYEYVVAGSCVIFMGYSLLIFRKITKGNEKDAIMLKRLVPFITALLVLDIVFSFEYSIFHRYRTFIMICFTPFVGYLMEKNSTDKEDKLKKYYKRFQLFFYLTFILSLIRGNNSNLKFFDFSNW